MTGTAIQQSNPIQRILKNASAEIAITIQCAGGERITVSRQSGEKGPLLTVPAGDATLTTEEVEALILALGALK